MKKGNVAAAVLFAALAAFVIVESSSLPGGRAGVPGPAVFPAAVAVLMLMAALSLVISSFRIPPGEDMRLNLLAPGSLRVYLCMAVMAAYVAVMPLAGFCAATSLFLFGLVKWFGGYRFHVCALSSLAVTAAVYLAFSELLYVPLRFGVLM